MTRQEVFLLGSTLFRTDRPPFPPRGCSRLPHRFGYRESQDNPLLQGKSVMQITQEGFQCNLMELCGF